MIGTIDSETDPFLKYRKPVPFAWCIYFNDKKYHMTWGKNSTQDILNIIYKLPKCTLYAHNGGKFDFHFFIGLLTKPPKVTIINGRIATIKIGKVTFKDSLLLIPAALGQYQKTKIDYNIFEAELREENKTEIVEYLLDDCRYLLELVLGFHEKLGNKLTIGACSILNMEKLGINIPHYNEHHDSKYRKYYFGGRVEAMKTGTHKKKLLYIDINSAYPNAMLLEHPNSNNYRVETNVKISDIKKRKGGAWFAHIIGVSRGALPFRKEDGGLAFPNDKIEREYFVTGWEIAAGLKTKTLDIKHIIEIRTPHETQNFKTFVNTYYDARMKAKKEDDKLSSLAFKLLLNSGYGKFCTDPRKFKNYIFYPIGFHPNKEEPEKYPVTLVTEKVKITLDSGFEVERDVEVKRGQYEEGSDVGHFTLWHIPAEIKSHSFFDVAVGASITGCVRAFLWESICVVKNPIYCDTDSIVCENSGVLKIGKKLGQWDIEATLSEAHIAGKKLYALKMAKPDDNGDLWKVASKGVKFDHKQVIRLCKGEKVKWVNDAPSFSLSRGVTFTEREISVCINRANLNN